MLQCAGLVCARTSYYNRSWCAASRLGLGPGSDLRSRARSRSLVMSDRYAYAALPALPSGPCSLAHAAFARILRAHARFVRFRAQSFFARNHVSTLLPAPHGVVAGFRPRAMEETSSYPMPSRAYSSAHMSWPPSSDSAIVLNGSVLRTASRHPRSGWQWPASPPGNS